MADIVSGGSDLLLTIYHVQGESRACCTDTTGLYLAWVEPHDRWLASGS
jgi:hypothetical protein